MKRAPNPSPPSPTTAIPITEPPANAISRALPRLVLAALVVLTFAFVATFIPMYPARAEHKAPTINETATKGEESVGSAETASSIATHTTKIESILYSDLRKAIAPSEIWLAIFFILSVPGSFLFIQEDLKKVNKSAITPKRGIT